MVEKRLATRSVNTMAAPMIRCARQVALRKIVVNRNVRQRQRSDGGDYVREHTYA
jgi:hypothetical protein